MLRVVSYGEYSPMECFLVRLCTLDASFFSRAHRALWEQNACETLYRIAVNYWRRALRSWRSRKAPRTHTQKAAI